MRTKGILWGGALLLGLAACQELETLETASEEAVVEPASADGPVNAVLGDESYVATFGVTPDASVPDDVRVSTHLRYVEELLRARDTSALPDELRDARAKNLDRLHAYWQAGRFPLNRPRADRVPRFLDDDEESALDDLGPRICAVGHLLSLDLGLQAAREISEAFEYDYVPDIESDALAAWAEQSGLSLEELAMIQPSYGFEKPKPQPPPERPKQAPAPSREEVERLLGSRAAAVDRCVHDRLGARAKHPGRIDAEVVVGPSGEVTSVKLSSDAEKEHLGIQGCVAANLAALSFSPFSGEPIKAKRRYLITTPTHADGSLNLSYVPIALRRAQPAVGACVKKHDPGEGLVELSVDASALPEGKLGDVRVRITSGPASAGFRSCVESAVSAVVLPSFKGSAKAITHGFMFGGFGILD